MAFSFYARRDLNAASAGTTLTIMSAATPTGGENQNADELLDQADQHFRANRLDQAAALLVRAAEIAPDDPRILRGLGIALVASHRAADALPALHRLTQLRSNDP